MPVDNKRIERAQELRKRGAMLVEQNVLTKAKATVTMLRNSRIRRQSQRSRKRARKPLA